MTRQQTTLPFLSALGLGIQNRLRDLDDGESNHDNDFAHVFVDEVHLLLLVLMQA